MPSHVTLLTDFGTRDGFVAAMKGVILGIAPDASVNDAGHEIAPGDVEAAAFVLGQYWDRFPEGTVHLAVVDPGVGGVRRALALEARRRYVVAPDNGLITPVWQAVDDARCVELSEPRYLLPNPSSTFHGRDIFAPAAAHLAAGVPIDRLGPPIDEPVLRAHEPARRSQSEIVGRVAHVDRFGNLITDIAADWLDESWRVEVAGRNVGGLRRAYSDVSEGDPVPLIGSLGTLEVAVRGGSAARQLGASRGDRVLCRRVAPPAGR